MVSILFVPFNMLFSIALRSLFLLVLATPRAVSADDDTDDDINNVKNNRYTATLTVAGTSINVTLDTGSTDMWINPPSVGPFESTGVSHKIAYGEGKTYINGTIGLSEVDIAGHKIPSQAFINVTDSAGFYECQNSGICGLVGLGFDNPAVGIENALSTAGMDGPTVGKSVLSSIFDMNPDKGRFFAFSLSRLGDRKGSADASLTIGDYDEKYADVEWEPKRPLYPEGTKSWRILSDGFSVNGVDIPWTVNSETTPAGKKLVGLDTGTTNILAKPEIVSAIYSAVPGAVLAKNSSLWNTHWSADKDVWVVPCNETISMTAYFEGHPYSIHPLDLSDMYTRVGPDGVNYTICVGTITNGGTITNTNTSGDALLGDSFLRNVYTVFSFGDNTTAPYVQFLSQTNEWQAGNDFRRVRRRRLAKSPPEIAPADLVQLFDGPSSSGTSASSFSTDSGSGEAGSGSSNSSSSSGSGSGASSGDDAGSGSSSNSSSYPQTTPSSGKVSVNLADNGSSSTTDSQANKYAPIIIGLLAANLLILLVLVFLGVMSFIRGSRKIGQTRAVNPQYTPVRLKEDVPRPSFEEDKSYA
ncbi:aspartic peptidase domain-containing protein [Mycena latifolia]|nr:aspartic peptidase domain-containing protein [Mycena latifolia]